MQAITALDKLPPIRGSFEKPTVFLGGSIEQGTAEDWQTRAANDNAEEDVIFLNPRRVNWNADSSEEEIRLQVEWELDALERADAVIIYLQPNTLSPISLLEFGLMCGQVSMGAGPMLVTICPEGFWRRTNVVTTASKYGVSVYSTLPEGLAAAIALAKRNFNT